MTWLPARANRLAVDWATYQPPAPTGRRLTIFDDYDLAEMRAYHRLDAVLHDVGAAGKYPDILDDKVGESARQPLPRRAGDAGLHYRGEMAARQRGLGLFPGERFWR